MNIDQLESQEYLKNTQVKGVRNPASLDSEECGVRNPASLDSEECGVRNQAKRHSEDQGSSEIDKLTLELLLNKTHYQKYLSKTDPQKHAEYCEFLDKLARFREDILQMTMDLLDNPKKMYTNEVGDAFNSYAKALVKYLEIEQANKSDNDDDDVLFPSSGTQQHPPGTWEKYNSGQLIIPVMKEGMKTVTTERWGGSGMPQRGILMKGLESSEAGFGRPEVPPSGTKEVKKPQSGFAKPRSAYGTLDQWIPRVKQ